MEGAEGLQQFSLVLNLVSHISGGFWVISMLRMEIIAFLSEAGSEYRGNPIQMQENENVDNLLKNCPMEVILGRELDISEI